MIQFVFCTITSKANKKLPSLNKTGTRVIYSRVATLIKDNNLSAYNS